MRHTKVVAGVLGIGLSALLARGAIAQLDPPAGPIVKTGKTLTEVEPRIAINATNTPGDADSLFKITQPGSYYLTGNVAGVVGKHGIEIAVSGVTLDLNGFDLMGVPSMGVFDAVTLTLSDQSNITVLNGSVRGWGDCGVDLQSLTSLNCRVEGVLASGNAGDGIATAIGSTISNCSAYFNAQTGISAGSGSTVTNCTAYDNDGSGITTGLGGTVVNCSAYNNALDGINTSIGNTVINCSAYGNILDGINTSSGNTVTNCSAFNNGKDGINAGGSSMISGCTSASNFVNGIVATIDSLVLNNNCDSNGDGGDGAGIFVPSGADTRVEGNNCTDNDRGIDVNSAGNLIIRNSCAGNTTNYDIAASNRYGPIVNIAASGAAAVTGSAATSTLTTTDPWANFAY